MTAYEYLERLTPEQTHGMLQLIIRLHEYVEWVERVHLDGYLFPMRNEGDGFMFEALDQYAELIKQVKAKK